MEYLKARRDVLRRDEISLTLAKWIKGIEKALEYCASHTIGKR